jgi:hypothetical protein
VLAEPHISDEWKNYLSLPFASPTERMERPLPGGIDSQQEAPGNQFVPGDFSELLVEQPSRRFFRGTDFSQEPIPPRSFS